MEIIANIMSTRQNKNYNNFTHKATQPKTHFYLTGIIKRL